MAATGLATDLLEFLARRQKGCKSAVKNAIPWARGPWGTAAGNATAILDAFSAPSLLARRELC